ncbi:uncharacterized protein CELE_R03G8.3 [Caenorhabditis elegans]|uniref:Uncharacterized protein n=1 Tax=Caenorhabditis elegans TaxID=6239 RepID=Q21672_CAEEL|nr:Uncharacterized protein CELE_R03G8.3 [Caenorhabditis elegans]CAA93678.3 Uncharacterized protein CELE_R03G8.3 [Caenorhabditis elegans]|eukprot:NP_510174.3 Uncharacterized protein CELE_R03G8.3 [Caenorhabditis elegans]
MWRHLSKMEYVPWKALLVTGCFAMYLVLLGFTMFSPLLSPQQYLGLYQPISGNIPSKVVMNKSEVEPWDQCELPQYDIWDDEILPYLNMEVNPISNCNKSREPLTFLNNGSWGVVNKKTKLICRARCHTRKSERYNVIGNWTYTPGPINCEVVEAVCADGKKDVYGFLHTQVIATPPKQPTVKVSELKNYDVTVIMLDSLSFTQAKRSLLRTISYMTNHMDAVLFPYINKVGDNSRPNGAALWFGKSLEKLDRSLFEEENVPVDWSHAYMCHVYKDNETSLFKEYQNYGYKTLMAEDWAEGTLNWPNCKGFDKPPIDHLMRPFQNALERANHGEPLTKSHLKNQKYCREDHHTLLDYLSQFINAYPDQNKFRWIWASILGHDSENGFPHSDKDFHKFLIKHREQLDNSFVFFMGDHGLRFGNVRKTFVGTLDVSNPFLAVSIPKNLRQTTGLLNVMRENAQKIQTHFDTRATMLDILKYQSASNFTDLDPLIIPGEKGYSYIRTQPDILRNCRNMPIPMQYCICQFNKTQVSTKSETAKGVGEAVALAVNNEIEEGKFTDKCVKMKVDHVVSLLQFDQKFKGSMLYTAVVEMTKPSKAVYKANVKILENGEVKVLGMVERSNKYGSTAYCIGSEHHRPYCYCKNQSKLELKKGR